MPSIITAVSLTKVFRMQNTILSQSTHSLYIPLFATHVAIQTTTHEVPDLTLLCEQFSVAGRSLLIQDSEL